ncbi:hypothetical protein Hypma_004754 [Hypsizygus marmoreus]|uniref:Sister chromatid cohesion C-terminal domain-containing protein n=1 Tax=Hypsizygus marmoreus TaxID=39966 RepID=A0A369IZZ2_HYPMA|nr:hypothetical protein Hypma_004754 [Hypsizygus marmoreus]
MPVALLQRWYSLVREKRASRQDFLKALVKVFQENSSQQASQLHSHRRNNPPPQPPAPPRMYFNKFLARICDFDEDTTG